jgi:uncharacterized protein (DUF885 family)
MDFLRVRANEHDRLSCFVVVSLLLSGFDGSDWQECVAQRKCRMTLTGTETDPNMAKRVQTRDAEFAACVVLFSMCAWTVVAMAGPARPGPLPGPLSPDPAQSKGSASVRPAAKMTPSQADRAFQSLADRYFNDYFHFRPDLATDAGLHGDDAELPAYTRGEIEAEITRNRRALKELDSITQPALSPDDRFDARLLESSIRGHLLSLADIREWTKDPNFYGDLASEALFVLVERDFAPVDERLKSLIARERRVPEVLASARANVQNPPAVYTEVAAEQAKDEIGFLENNLPQAVSAARDQNLKAEFARVNQQTITAWQGFLDYLQHDLAARSHGDFAIGAENYRKKLLYDEMVDTPLDRLLEIGQAELRKTQGEFDDTAKLIDPTKSPGEVLASLSADHPDAVHLLAENQSVLAGLRDFLASHAIVTLPSAPDPQVVETPPFMRALTFASMDTPGPYEEHSTQSFYNVTLPTVGWSPDKTEQYLRSFDRYTIRITSIHEVYPGHYIQFLWVKRVPSKVRKLAGLLLDSGEVGSNGEGWAHYCEQMMLEQGYGEGDPRLLLFQLHAALLRICRYNVGIRMHTAGMTVDEATRFFEQQGYVEPPVAEREALRGTSDPTYLVYTLGKLQILKLRDDYQQKMGDNFSLKDFHDRFLSFGNVPNKLIREQMLGNDSPTL